MKDYLLDTCIVSQFIHREARQRYPRVVERVTEVVKKQGAYVSIVTVYELRRGIELLRLQGSGRKKEVALKMFLHGVTTLSLDDNGNQGWSVAARVHAHGQARQPAITLGEGDLLIAATAIAHSRILLTSDSTLGTRFRDLGLPELVEVVPFK